VENAQENVTYCSCNSCGQVTENTFENICENGCPHCGSFEIEVVDF
jgi:Zn finger protein HypA/HybF involved in hydrogenase expression